jgi:hypothetical protein
MSSKKSLPDFFMSLKWIVRIFARNASYFMGVISVCIGLILLANALYNPSTIPRDIIAPVPFVLVWFCYRVVWGVSRIQNNRSVSVVDVFSEYEYIIPFLRMLFLSLFICLIALLFLNIVGSVVLAIAGYIYEYVFLDGASILQSWTFHSIIVPAVNFASYCAIHIIFFIILLYVYTTFHTSCYSLDKKPFPYLYMMTSALIFSVISLLLSYTFSPYVYIYNDLDMSVFVYDKINIFLLIAQFLYAIVSLTFIMIVGYAYQHVYCTKPT